jgi:hypothetical protein
MHSRKMANRKTPAGPIHVKRKPKNDIISNIFLDILKVIFGKDGRWNWRETKQGSLGKVEFFHEVIG